MRLTLARAAAPFLFSAAALLAAPALAAGVDTPYARTDKTEAFGYYLPTAKVQTGNYALNSLSLGTAEEFDAWEAAPDLNANYAPFMLSFDDVTSSKAKDENGGTYYTRSIRVLPTAYSIGTAAISFSGKNDALGMVHFEGTLNRAALKTAVDSGTLTSQDKTVLSGTLTAGGKTFKNITFTWFGGD